MKDNVINISIDEAIKVLNEAISLDRTAMTILVNSRVICNDTLANHPTIQVGDYHVKDHYTVGLLGILNGLFGCSSIGGGYIGAVFDCKCSNGHFGNDLQNKKIYENCPKCGEKIKLGEIIEFIKLGGN